MQSSLPVSTLATSKNTENSENKRKSTAFYTHRTAWPGYLSLEKANTGEDYNVLWNDQRDVMPETQARRAN